MTVIRHAVFEAEARAVAEADTEQGVATISGYASVFGSRNYYGEIFVPGAFSETLDTVGDDKPLPMVDMHRQAIGRWTSFEEDTVGLRLDGVISDTGAGRDVATLLRDGAVNGLSIGFLPQEEYLAEPGETVNFDTVNGGTWTSQSDRWTYYVLRARLVEVSVVYAPADDQARVLSVRAIAPEQAATALPGLRAEATWDDVAWSMCKLMGAPGAGLADLTVTERAALHARLADAYTRHDKTAPEFAAAPDYKTVPFKHDEPSIYLELNVRKRLSRLIADLGPFSQADELDRPISDETRARAIEARTAIDRLLEDELPAPTAPELDAAAVAAELRELTSIIES